MGEYYLIHGQLYSEDELYHYGVKGMKWGVRKAEYKAMNRTQRRNTRKQYLNTPEGKIHRATVLGTIFGGPLVGSAIGLIANKKYNFDSVRVSASKGKKIIDENANKKVSELSTKTESKRVADIKSRVTGRKENGKPAFMMSQEELNDFSATYERRRKTLTESYKKTTDEKSKQRIRNEYDRLEEDYLSVVEQDFWYADD